MKNIISYKRSLGLVLAALALVSFISSMSSAQTTYKRSGIIEEFTGTWCGYCPRGAWFMDSLQDYMPNNVVEIAWHNADEMTIPNVEDTAEGYFGVTGFPSVGFMRTGASGVNDWSTSDPMYTAMKNVCKQTPLVDCRIVNAAYDPSTHICSFDLDVTPYDMSKMPTEDTEYYRTLAVLTEDGLIYDQHNYSLRGLPNPISPFVHYNVARAVGGSVRGDAVTLGTQDPNATLPLRVHYEFTVDYMNWNANQLRVKTAFDAINLVDVVISGKKYKAENNNVMNAAQTGYIATLPTSAPDKIWIVLPNANSTTSASKPTQIIWAHGGNTSNSAKIEWSGDNGTTWNLVTANTTNSPYNWDIPTSAYGQTVILRATDVANGSVKSNSEPFKTPGIVHITHPAAGDVFTSGNADSVTFTGGNLTTKKTLYFSSDSMQTWTPLKSLSSATATTIAGFSWNVASTSTACFVKFSDDNGVSDISGQFTVKAQGVQPGKIKTVAATRMYGNPDSIAVGDHSTISWTTDGGPVGNTITISLSTDNGVTWMTTPIAQVTGDNSSFNWNPIPDYPTTEAMIRVQGDLQNSGSATFGPFTIYKDLSGVARSEAFGYSISNYPNPFAAATKITFVMAESGHATMSVRDQLGREVGTIANGTFEAGQHELSFDASKLSTGIYTVTFESNGVRLVKQLNVVK